MSASPLLILSLALIRACFVGDRVDPTSPPTHSTKLTPLIYRCRNVVLWEYLVGSVALDFSLTQKDF